MINSEFLLNYVPSSSLFTSREEMDIVTEKLSLLRKSKQELREVRDNVVKFYIPYIDKQFDENLEHDYMNAMQSITGVIDYYIYGQICGEENI